MAKALAVDGVVGLEITIPINEPVVRRPEGNRCLGLIVARERTLANVEATQRHAEAALDVTLRPTP